MSMMLSLNIQVSCRLEQQQLCKLCHLNVEDARSNNTMRTIALFGYKKYGVCPSCGNDTEHMIHDKNYQRRVRRWRKNAKE